MSQKGKPSTERFRFLYKATQPAGGSAGLEQRAAGF